MIKILLKDITALKNSQVIVNAANGKGIMGAGVAGAIAREAGVSFKKEVKKVCEDHLQANGRMGYGDGECYLSSSGDLQKRGIEKVYHAVTMEYPGGRTSLHTISQAMRAALDLAISNNVKSIAFPALGTGIGGLDKQQVASIMVGIAQSYADRLDIALVDIDDEFIDYAKKRVQVDLDERSTRTNINSE